MEKKRKVIVIPQCILTPGFYNSSQKSPEERKEIIEVLLKAHTGIIQLPCPHLSAVYSQSYTELSKCITVEFKNKHNSDFYLKQYHKMLKPIISKIEQCKKHGIQLAGLIGIKDSPCCSIHSSLGKDQKNDESYMQTLIQYLNKESISINMVNI